MHFTTPTGIVFLLITLSAKLMALSSNVTEDLLPRDLGINCRGSSLCSHGPLQKIIDITRLGPRGCPGRPGEQMYCTGHFCAFTQHTSEDISPETALRLLNSLKAHGCDGCGSVPLLFPNDDPSSGILTVNYVAHSQGVSHGVDVSFMRVC